MIENFFYFDFQKGGSFLFLFWANLIYRDSNDILIVFKNETEIGAGYTIFVSLFLFISFHTD